MHNITFRELCRNYFNISNNLHIIRNSIQTYYLDIFFKRSYDIIKHIVK